MCQLGFVGVSNKSFIAEDFIPWTFVGDRCQRIFYLIQVVYSLLVLLIVASNVCILVVLLNKNHRAHNSTLRLYKVSLAVADLLVGVVSLPYILVKFASRLSDSNPFQTQLNGGQIDASFGQKSTLAKLSDICACIFVTSFYASILTLITAAVDRFSAIRFPFRNQKWHAAFARYFLVVIWLVSVALSASVFIRSRFINQYASFMMLPVFSTNVEVYVHGSFLVIPLISMWVVNGLTLSSLREYNRTSKIRISRGGGVLDERQSREKSISIILVRFRLTFRQQLK